MDVKLDRTICNTDYYSTWSNTVCRNLIREFSDHRALLLKFDIFVRSSSKSFRFLACWLQNDGLLDVIKASWDAPIPFTNNPIIIMMLKLKRLKIMLKIGIGLPLGMSTRIF